MAKNYKEGVDFEWVKGNAKNTKVRRFFSAAEKKALSAPKPTATATTPATSKPKTKAVVKEKPSPISGAARSTKGKVVNTKPVVDSTAPTMGNNDIKPVRLKKKK